MGRPAFFLVPAALAQVPAVVSWSLSLGALSATLALALRHPAYLSSYKLRCQVNQLHKVRRPSHFSFPGGVSHASCKEKGGLGQHQAPKPRLEPFKQHTCPPLVVGVPAGLGSLPSNFAQNCSWEGTRDDPHVKHLRRKYTNSAATKCTVSLFKEEKNASV